VPRGVRFVSALPRSGMNKVLKEELRATVNGAGGQ
jgi:acyl-coenzyme A synthetase/AMP-(fatty) acid ligase